MRASSLNGSIETPLEKVTVSVRGAGVTGVCVRLVCRISGRSALRCRRLRLYKNKPMKPRSKTNARTAATAIAAIVTPEKRGGLVIADTLGLGREERKKVQS